MCIHLNEVTRVRLVVHMDDFLCTGFEQGPAELLRRFARTFEFFACKGSRSSSWNDGAMFCDCAGFDAHRRRNVVRSRASRTWFRSMTAVQTDGENRRVRWRAGTSKNPTINPVKRCEFEGGEPPREYSSIRTSIDRDAGEYLTKNDMSWSKFRGVAREISSRFHSTGLQARRKRLVISWTTLMSSAEVLQAEWDG